MDESILKEKGEKIYEINAMMERAVITPFIS